MREHAIDAVRVRAAARGAVLLALALTLQAALGIFTLLEQAPLVLALTHQAMALIVLTLASLHAARAGFGLQASASACSRSAMMSA